MLKKQTIWLLTMLSLMIVLSIYYVMSPNEDDLAYVNDGKKSSEETSKASETDGASVDDVTNLGQDELFTTIRMNLEDKRSEEKSRLNDIVASSEASAEEKNKALEQINHLDDVATKEAVLEESIQSNNNYPDVLVRADGDKVHVHVKVNELSEKEVLDIMQEVRAEFERDVTVDVNFQGSAAEKEE